MNRTNSSMSLCSTSVDSVPNEAERCNIDKDFITNMNSEQVLKLLESLTVWRQELPKGAAETSKSITRKNQHRHRQDELHHDII